VIRLDKCDLCKKQDEDLTLLSANHKKLGRIWICQDCWTKLYQDRNLVCDLTGSGSSCPTCG